MTVLCVMLLATVASAAVVRPASVTWALVQDTSYFNAVTGLEHYIGIKAAEKFINDNDLLSGTTVDFEFVKGVSLASTSVDIASTMGNLTAMNPFGYLVPDWSSSELVVPLAKATGKPVVNPKTMIDVYNLAHRNVLFSRQPLASEAYGMLNYALNAESQCSYTAIVAPDFPGLQDVVNLAIAAVQTANQPAPLVITVTDTEFFTNLTAVIRERFFSTSPRIPGCALLIGVHLHVVGYIDALWGDPRLDRANTYFITTSAATALQFGSSAYGTAPYANLRLVFPSQKPTDTKYPSVAAYQAAVNAFVATGPTIPTEMLTNVPAATLAQLVAGEYTYSELNAFYTAMFAAEVMRDISLTSANFIDAVYRRKLVNINEVIFGPFSDACLMYSSTTFPCFCNTGGRSFYIAQVNLTTGLLIGGVANEFLQDGDLLSLTTSLDGCAMSASSVQQPLNMAMLFHASGLNAVETASQRQFALSVVSTAVHANTEGGAASAGRFNPILKELTDASADDDALLFNLTVRSNPYVLLGGDVATRRSGIPSLFGNAVDMQAADPALAAATQYSHYELRLTPVLADYIHTLALFATAADGLAATGAGAGAGVFVACAEASAGSTVLRDLAVQSLHTFQVRPAEVTGVAGAAEAAGFAQRVVDRASGGAATVALFATLNETACGEFVAELAARAAAGLTTPAQQSALTVLVAAPELGLFVAKETMAARGLSLPAGTRVYFASAQQEWWTATSELRDFLVAVRNTTDASVVEHPSAVRGLLASLLLYSVTSVMAGTQALTHESLVEYIYTAGTLTSYGASYGPLYNLNCTADELAAGSVARTCQCYKGPRTFYALTLNDWVARTSGTSGAFAYMMTTCGVQYEALVEPSSSLSVGVIAGAAAAGGVALLAGVGLFGCCVVAHGKRDNRRAPKDASRPFAMMFTDIQSSTSLWARAPEQMGVSVEKHHDELRALIAKHGGYEVKTIGDSFMVAFEDARQATEMALSIQSVFYGGAWPAEIDATYRGLAQEAEEDAMQEGKALRTAQNLWEDEAAYRECWNGVRVRVGLHWGMGSIKLDPVSQGYDYYGTVVNTAARVEGVGNGGQVLATKELYDELERRGDFDFSAVDVVPLGPQPLRGLDAPIPLYQLNPTVLKARTFNPLRLDVENAAEEDAEGDIVSSNGTASVSASQASNFCASTEDIVRRLLRNKHAAPGFKETVLFSAGFLEVAFSTSTKKWRKETMAHLLRKWHVATRKRLGGQTEEQQEVAERLQLVTKVSYAQEERRRGEGAARRMSVSSVVATAAVQRLSTMQHVSSGAAFGPDDAS